CNRDVAESYRDVLMRPLKSSTYTLNSKRASSYKQNTQGWRKLFEDVGSRDAAVKPPWKGLRRSSKGSSQPKITLKKSNWPLLSQPAIDVAYLNWLVIMGLFRPSRVEAIVG
ncbi:MAG: hypothetical protein Q8K07_21650, partial [Methylicorpusculum sp.]|uniref:hypothetical protein n=1 Tax=Methylicorpusculum sp. TaxID=2713644 RepID=UPI00272F8ED2